MYFMLNMAFRKYKVNENKNLQLLHEPHFTANANIQ